MRDSESCHRPKETLVTVIIHDDYEGPLTLVKANKCNRELAKRFPNQYRVRRIQRSVLLHWRAEFARFGLLQEIVRGRFNHE